MDVNKIYNMDCIEGMKQLPDNSIDLILTDPPYNISSDKKLSINDMKDGETRVIDMDFGDWDKNKIFPKDYLDIFVRVLKETGILVMFYDNLYLGLIGIYLQNKHNFKIRNMGCWIKSNPAPQLRNVRWMNAIEQFIVITKNNGSGHHYNYKLGQSTDCFVSSISFEHLHPTQKPLDLIEWILKYWSFENDVVLDPFLGSGTTMVACKMLKRKYIGFELEKKYYDIANKRLNEVSVVYKWI